MLQKCQQFDVRLREPFDLRFVDQFGTVFCVFDQGVTGNLCFGIEGKERLFLKFAGAPTERYPGTQKNAVERLRRAADLLSRAPHPALAQYLDAFPVGGGFALMTRFENAFPIGPYPEFYARFRAFPLLDRLRSMDQLIDLHEQLARRDLIAAGLFDEHFLADDQLHTLRLCSISDYLSLPFVNGANMMKGSPYFLPPEAYERGIKIDESATVYALGAMATMFFGDRQSITPASFGTLSPLFPLVKKATDKNRSKRYYTVEAFRTAWRQGVSDLIAALQERSFEEGFDGCVDQYLK